MTQETSLAAAAAPQDDRAGNLAEIANELADRKDAISMFIDMMAEVLAVTTATGPENNRMFVLVQCTRIQLRDADEWLRHLYDLVDELKGGA